MPGDIGVTLAWGQAASSAQGYRSAARDTRRRRGPPSAFGWIQIIPYCATNVALAPVLGCYMTRVFNGVRGDGKDVIRRAREWSEVPIIVLSAREREAEKIESLDLGADDYLNKPFNVGELMAPMRTALRHRMQRMAEVPVLRIGDLEINAVRHRVARAGSEVKLTPKEFDPLSFLARHAGRVITHRQILAAIWGPAHTEDTQYLCVYVGQLGQKIEVKADDPRIVLTVPGIGYRIAER